MLDGLLIERAALQRAGITAQPAADSRHGVERIVEERIGRLDRRVHRSRARRRRTCCWRGRGYADSSGENRCRASGHSFSSRHWLMPIDEDSHRRIRVGAVARALEPVVEESQRACRRYRPTAGSHAKAVIDAADQVLKRHRVMPRPDDQALSAARARRCRRASASRCSCESCRPERCRTIRRC